MKYRPAYPTRPFDSLDEAQAWVTVFAHWYNTEHRHSGIRFVTPEQRHQGADLALLEARSALYERARREHPERWSRSCRNWAPVEVVTINTGKPLNGSLETPHTEEQEEAA